MLELLLSATSSNPNCCNDRYNQAHADVTSPTFARLFPSGL